MKFYKMYNAKAGILSKMSESNYELYYYSKFLVLINGVAKNLVHLKKKKKKIETRMSPLSLHFNYECKSV